MSKFLPKADGSDHYIPGKLYCSKIDIECFVVSSFEEPVRLAARVAQNFFLDKGKVVLCLGQPKTTGYMRFLYGEQIIAAPWWDSATLSCLFEQVEESQ